MKNYRKTDNFEPIAMRCNEGQFNELKPILKKFGLIINSISDDFKYYHYLTNNFIGKKQISNINKDDTTGLDYCNAVCETFNAEIFLKACGIVEKSEKVKIRTELLKQLAENNSFSEELIKKEFPQLFESELEVGKWYNYKGTNTLVFLEDLKKNKGYGFYDGKFESTHEKWAFYLKDKWTLATPQEVETALINEAKKRGYRKGVTCLFGDAKDKRVIKDGSFRYNLERNTLSLACDVLFKNGIWAEIIETPTDIITIVEKYGKDKVISLIEKM